MNTIIIFSFSADTIKKKFFVLNFFSNEILQSKQTRVSFDQNDESNDRYEFTFPAYLEV